MKLKQIHVENFKTYRHLELNLDAGSDEKTIILIGGGNGCGKTTLFDAIYHALYGLKIKDKRQFDELFNAGVKNERGLAGNKIVLDLTFTGMVLDKEFQYRLSRSYLLMGERLVESTVLDMGGNTFTYGSGTPAKQRQEMEETEAPSWPPFPTPVATPTRPLRAAVGQPSASRPLRSSAPLPPSLRFSSSSPSCRE